MSFPGLNLAAADPALLPRDVQVLVVLARDLDVLAYRPIKEITIRRQLRIGRATLWRSLHRLAAQGYLERSPWQPGGVTAYRLVYNPVPPMKRADAS